ncbi:WD repeat-containing protein 91-like [Babylonia areolata]|uniref:WD repeat-containing protein 91-like n=1 Tax=Babylonia areolata TaxID=304850 RepID=UPI003FD613FD
MATACERLDELVKDYLLFRGFTATAKALDHEVKYDKDRGLRADKMVEQLRAYVDSHDLQHLREYWAHLNQRFFSRLEQRYAASVRKLEVSLLKLYVVSAHQSSRPDRVRDFFEKIGSELQNQLEFRDWFVFPFVSNPAENGNFALYFTRQWQETVQLSLHNFLQVVLQAMPVPTLLNFDHDTRRMQALLEENESLRNQVNYSTAPDKKVFRTKPSEQSIPQPLPDLIYDFSGLADGSHEGSTEVVSERQKSSRRFPINLSTPLLKRNKQPDSRPDIGAGSSVASSQGNQSSNNTAVEPHTPHSLQHPSSCGSHTMPVSGALLTTSAFSTVTQAGASFSAVPSQLKSIVVRSMSEPQEASLSGSGQQCGPGDSVLVAGPRKKGPRELTSFPPYTSPQWDKQESLPVRTNSLTAADQFDMHSHRDKTVGLSEAVIPEEMSTQEAASLGSSDYGLVEPLQQIPEGKQCPFLVLSDDVYLEHRSAVCYSRFSLSGHHVASLDTDGIVKVWTWSPQPSTTATVMSRAPFLSLDWASKSDRWLLLGNQSGQIRLFDTREIKTFREASVESPNLRVTFLSACPSTMMFASCMCGGDSSTDTGKLALWDLKTMKMERYLAVDPQPVMMTCCVYSGNGKLLVAAGSDGFVRLYDVGQRQCVKKWKTGKVPQQTVQFAGQDTSLFTMGTDDVLCEWSLSHTDQPVRQIEMRDSGRDSVQCSHARAGVSCGQLFSLSKDRAYLLYARHRQGVICKTGEGQTRGSMQKILELSGHTDMVSTVDWSPCIDTPVCLTGSCDGQLRVATLLSQ